MDRSGRVDLKDLALVTSHVGKKLTDKNRVYDVNDDGTINLVDVALVTKKVHDSKGGGKR